MSYTKYVVRNVADRFMLVQQKDHNKTELADIRHNRYTVEAKHFTKKSCIRMCGSIHS